ncbi:TA2R9 protein, partial [Podargus strigoides]|nr:TA2R9 protein [Podargus strigoides]
SQDSINATTYNAISVVIITLQALPGMWINAFIVSVLCIAWVKKKSFNSNEKILLLLGCLRFWYLCITWMYSFASIIYPSCIYAHPIPQLFAASQTLLNCSNLWVSACLSVFYCIKIANFRHNFFNYLKVKIDRIVPWLLLGSVLLSLVMCIIVYEITDEVHCNNLNSTTLENFWKPNLSVEEYFLPLYVTCGFVFAGAFMAVIFSAFLLLCSLWKHKRKMQTNSVKNLRVEAHIKAMKSILSFFFIYSMNFVFLILILIYSLKKETEEMLLFLMFQYTFPSVHSLILIFSNPKLEKTLLRTLSWVKCKVCMR